jgi:16S rRNA C1402 (ribose-2'-O) methylase RsmI
LLKHFGISAKQISHHEHNWQQKAPEIVEMARLGHAHMMMMMMMMMMMLVCMHEP